MSHNIPTLVSEGVEEFSVVGPLLLYCFHYPGFVGYGNVSDKEGFALSWLGLGGINKRLPPFNQCEVGLEIAVAEKEMGNGLFRLRAVRVLPSYPAATRRQDPP